MNKDFFEKYSIKPDKKLREKIIMANIGLARKVAIRFSDTCDEPYEDLEQVSFVGLIKAVDEYDTARGSSFATYAMPKIRGEVLHYLRDKRLIKSPRSWVDRGSLFKKLVENGASPEEIEKKTKIVKEDQEYAKAGLRMDSFDQTIPNGDGDIYLDIYVPSTPGDDGRSSRLIGGTWLDPKPILDQHNKILSQFRRDTTTALYIRKLAPGHILFKRIDNVWHIHYKMIPQLLNWVDSKKYFPMLISVLAERLAETF
jgi:RNA polymerase sigma factor (sigma-70 family)